MNTDKSSSQNLFKSHAFSAAIALSLVSAVPVLAESRSHQSAISEAEQVYLFNFSSKPLPQAIAEFSAVSGVQVLYTEQSVYKHQAPALKGSYSPSEALKLLLSGSELNFQFTGQNSVTLIKAMTEHKAQESLILPAMMVTSASGMQHDINNAPASISVITSEELGRRQFSSLQDIVRDIPGISVIGSGEQSGISIRGMEKGYTLVLVDGKRVRSETGNPRELNNEDLDSAFIPPLANIERIEVIRGPMSSLYGSDAMGGVINVITKNTPENWSGSITFGHRVPYNRHMGKQNQRNINISGPLVKDLIGLSLWGNETLQDEDKYYGGFQESTKSTFGGRLRVTPNQNHRLDFDFSQSSQHFIGNPGGVLLSDARRTIDRKWTRDAWGVSYEAQFDQGHMELKYYEEDYERLTYPSNASYTTGSTNRVGDARFVTGVGNHYLTVGAQWTNDRLTNNELGGGRSGAFGTRNVTEVALFAEDEWELIDDKLNLTVGARLTDNDFFGKHLSPRSYLVFNHNDRWTFKGGIGTGYKSPKIAQIDSTTGSQRGGGSEQFVIQGNPDLKPEKSINYELSGLYTNNHNLSAGLTLFHNDFSNKILNTSPYFFDSGSGERISAYCDSGAVGSRHCPGWATWLNANGAKIRGIELDGRWDLSDTITLKGNYTFTDSKIDAGNITINTPAGPRDFGDTLAKFDGNSLVGIPKHNASMTLDYRPTDALSGFFTTNYEGQITRVSFENNTVDSSNKDLITMDAGLSYQFNRNFTFNFVVDNITDAKRFRINEDTGAYRFSERGRSYYASVTAKF